MNIFINKTKWDKFSNSQMMQFKQEIFDYYRGYGFPLFNLSPEQREHKFKTLIEYDHSTLLNNGIVHQTMHGLSLSWHYHPHRWSIKCGNMKTPLEIFNDDSLFKKAIDKRIKYGTYISDSGIRKTLCTYSGTQAVSNFRPTVAAAIYHKYMPKDGTTWDMSIGFGGRL